MLLYYETDVPILKALVLSSSSSSNGFLDVLSLTSFLTVGNLTVGLGAGFFVCVPGMLELLFEAPN